MTRRSVLAGAGCAMAATAAGQMLSSVARAQDAGAAGAGLCMTMLFPADPKAKFDAGKFATRHLPLLREVYGDSIERAELRVAAPSAMGMPSALLAISTLWIRDVPAFGQKLGANAERINKDLDSAAKGNRLVQVDRVVLELGDARGAIAPGSQSFSMFYPLAPARMRGMGPPGMPGRAGASGGAGARGTAPPGGAMPPGGAVAPAPGTPPTPAFDAAYFASEYLPRLHALYGPEALARIEATVGQDQGGQKPAHIAACHLMIRDRKAYEAKSATVFTELQNDAGRLTTIFPTLADMRIHTIA